MKNIYFTVGPTHIFPTVSKHLPNAIKKEILPMSHRDDEFHKMFSTAQQNLKKLLTIPQNYEIFFISSATEAWERIAKNGIEKNSFHFVNGSFGKKFYKAALSLGKNAVSYEVPAGEGFTDPTKIEIPKDTELIGFTHNESSTGVALPPELIYKVHTLRPNALIAVDVVSSIPYVDLDYTQLDYVYFSVQKGMGLPPGLAVMVVSPRAMEKAQYLEKKGMIPGYHDLSTLKKFSDKGEAPETPNVIGIYLFSKVTQDMLKIGIQKIREETKKKATQVYKLFDDSEIFSSFIKDPTFRSDTVIVADVRGGSQKIMKALSKKGLIVGGGYGSRKDTQIRVGNFPSHSVKDMQKLLKALKEFSV